MQIPIEVQTPDFTLYSTGPTKVEPGEMVEFIIRTQSLSSFEIVDFAWKVIDPLISTTQVYTFPIPLQPNETKEFRFNFKSKLSEGFGEVQAFLKYRTKATSADIKTVQWNHWISVFKRIDVGLSSSLENSLRDRLIKVVNTRLINGFLFMADYQKFFDHYLNIKIPDALAQIIGQQLQLELQPLPVDEETFIRMAMGEVSYYGIEKFELIAEEECVESDDRFDSHDIKEVRHPDIDI